MSIAVGGERDWLGSLRAFHGEQKLLLAGTGRMEGEETRCFGALDAGAFSDVADAAFLHGGEIKRMRGGLERDARASTAALISFPPLSPAP